MIKVIVAVFVGGAVGAILRELFMLIVPNLADGFPLDILAANLVASLLLGFATALHSRKVVSDGVNSLLGTGIAGGLSTFPALPMASSCWRRPRRRALLWRRPTSWSVL